MKNCLLFLCFINCTVAAFAQSPAVSTPSSAAQPAVQIPSEPTLSSLAASIVSTKGQRTTMELRLRNIDMVMEKIWFYDKENVDIVFDIHRWEKNPVLVRSMENAHPGVRYRVVFSPESVMTQGILEGKLESFEPVFLDKLK